MPTEIRETSPAKTVTAQLDALFAPWNRTDTPGLIAGVVKDGKTIYRRGFAMASLETCVANSPKTRMRIASISKHFTALLALLLAEEGKLDLDTPVRTYIPELRGPGGDPTLRLLMQHRGGSRCYTNLGFLLRGMTGPPPLGTMLATQVRQKGRNFAPGEAMIYNNGGYHLISIVIERVGNMPFEIQLKRRLFDPLGMADTALIPSDYDITAGIATMHLPLADGGWRRALWPSNELLGEGGIVSTIDDMLRWTTHLRSRDRFGSSATWAALTELPIFPDGTVGVYALGLWLRSYRGLPTVRHSGSVVGGSSYMLTFPDHGLDIVILANGALGADPVKLAERIADIMLAGQLGESSPTIPAANYSELLGDWWSPETEMLYRFIEQQGALKLWLCGDSLPLERLSDGRVVSPASALSEIGVELDEAARGGDLTITFGGHSAVYRKLSKEMANTAVFAQGAIGQYYSHDADCMATITYGEQLLIAFTDPYGYRKAVMHALSDRVGHIEPTSIPRPIHAVLTLTFDDEHVTGFRLNTVRLRNLVFMRLPLKSDVLQPETLLTVS